MASRATSEKWLGELTHLPTASGLEQAVMDWVATWVVRRPDLRLQRDSGGNLLITQKGRRRHEPVLAVAHMDHPAFVVESVDGKSARFQFRGGVRAEYFADAAVEFVTGKGTGGRVVEYSPSTHTGVIALRGPAVEPGDVARWRLRGRRAPSGRFRAPACDDLAGCAAALAALDRARQAPELRHFGVLLTRAEEMGFVGALHAGLSGSIPEGSRILSIEASRTSREAPLGAGPIVRVGDASSVFDSQLTNVVTDAVRASGMRHQRKLMAGGSCEATAFGGLGYPATGLCLALDNYHNMGDLDAVEAGTGKAVAKMEEISLEDFHDLVGLLLVAAAAVDNEPRLGKRLVDIYDEGRHLLT